MRRSLAGLAAGVAVAILGGCGGSAPAPSHLAPPQRPVVAAPAVCDPAPGYGHMGACTTQPGDPNLRVSAAKPPTLLAPRGTRYFPDVYEGEGRIDWASAHAKGLQAAIVKAYEVNYQQDSQFDHSWRQLSALHIWHAAYLFARAGNCNAIADRFVAIVNSAGGWDAYAGPPVLDVEVASAFGMVPCLAARVRHDTGIATVVTYTAPGTFPGGGSDSTPLWIATYGSSFGCQLWTCHPLAWQFTDGTWGPGPHCVFGLPCGDVNIDYGLTAVLAHPAPPRIHCFGANWDRKAALCKKVRPEVARRSAEIVRIRALLIQYGCRTAAGAPGPNQKGYRCQLWFKIGDIDTSYIRANLY